MPWSALAGATASWALNKYGGSGAGGGGGSGGGNARPVYQMAASPAFDQNFQDTAKLYQDSINSNQGITNPLSQNLLRNQWDNPYNQGLMQAANNASINYNNAGNQTANSGTWMGQNGDELMAMTRNIQNQYNQNQYAVQGDTNNMRQMAMDSNGAYDQLTDQQKAQLGFINNSSRNLYGASGNAMQTTDQLTNFLGSQQGNIQGAMNQGYGAAANAYDTTNNLVGMQQGQAGNAYGQAQQLYGAASQLQNDAFDPRRAQYEKNVGDLQENVRAAEYARGIQMSPAGASVEADAMENFQNNWQNQQLAREAQGVGAAQGAAQSAQGLTNNFANNISGLQAQGYGTAQGQQLGAQSMADTYAQNVAGVQGRGYGTAAGAAQSGQGMQNSYSQVMSGLNDSKNSQYANMSQAANQNVNNFLTSQANNQNSTSGAINNAYAGQNNLLNNSANYYAMAGQMPYNAYQQNAGNQQNALQNYNTNQQPYLSGLIQNQNAALAYINNAQGLQNQGWSQNYMNQQANNNAIGHIAGPLGTAAQNIWNKYMGNNSGSNGFNSYGGTYGDNSGYSSGYNSSGDFSGSFSDGG